MAKQKVIAYVREYLATQDKPVLLRKIKEYVNARYSHGTTSHELSALMNKHPEMFLMSGVVKDRATCGHTSTYHYWTLIQ